MPDPNCFRDLLEFLDKIRQDTDTTALYIEEHGHPVGQRHDGPTLEYLRGISTEAADLIEWLEYMTGETLD